MLSNRFPLASFQTSELDFLEWSPSGNEFMITDNMSADTLLSTLAQYPFPDSREIGRCFRLETRRTFFFHQFVFAARGAGRADFIQPSLGPLQPNFDDLMDLDLDFLNFPRLPPVPEEGSEDILKAIEYNYPSGWWHSCNFEMKYSLFVSEQDPIG